MKRFYYLTASIDSVQHISRDLDRAGIDAGRLHVLGRDPGPLEAAKVHGTTIWEDTGIMHTGFLGALTTFSSFSAEMFINLQAGRWGLALGGIAAHVVGSLCMTGLGLGMVALARQLLTR